jgi:hypothetical protein
VYGSQRPLRGHAASYKRSGVRDHGHPIHTPAEAPGAPSYLGPFLTVTAVFHLRVHHQPEYGAGAASASIFDLPYAWAMLAESAFFLAYFVFSSPTSKLIEVIGYKKTMVVSLFHSGGWLPALCAGGEVGEFSALSDGGFRGGRGRHGAADLGQSYTSRF